MSRWPEDYGRVELLSVESTLDTAKELAREQHVPFWLLAHRQTAARGRRGRKWESAPGNFAATVALRPTGTMAEAALRSFVISLALFRALSEISRSGASLALKWPNDVLLNGGKVAGILLESGQNGLLLIGVGVNLAAAPSAEQVEAEAILPVSVSEALSVTVEPTRFLSVLAYHFAELEAQFSTYGFAPVRRAWLAQAARLGETVTARLANEEIQGVFEDVDDQGQLVLRAPQGLHRIAAADVYF